MSTKRGPLLVVTAAVFAIFTLLRLDAAPDAPLERFAEPLLPQHTEHASFEPSRPRSRQVARATRRKTVENSPETHAFSSAGSPAPLELAALDPLIDLSQLETERDFQALAAAMRRVSSADASEKQRAYEADFASFPETARGVRVEDLSCDERNCIGQISAQHQDDIDKFMLTAATGTRYPIYTAQQVVVEDGTQALRRFAISTDADLAELTLPEEEAAAVSGTLQIRP